MAAGDLALRVLISANAGSAIAAIGGLGGAVGGIFKNLLGNAQLLAFGLKNIGTAGVDGMGAVKAGAAGLMGGLVALVALLVVVGTVAAIAIGTIAVKAAADFQQGLLRLVTGAGDTTDNMQKLGQGILAVSVATGVAANGTQGLNAAMYLIISSGQRGAQALDTLSVAAKGAQIEQANVVDVANVLSGVMTNYGTKVYSATDYMNGLIRAVQLGKITLQDLSVAMGPIDPIAHSLGISFNDTAAAMTTQTNAMIPAARAATGLRFMMLALENPTKKATDAMKAMGLSSVDVANEMKVSLPGALQMIYNAAKKAGPEGSVPFDRAVADMVGGIRSLSTFTALTGEHLKTFIQNSKDIAAAMKASQDAVMGWTTAQAGFNIQMDKAKAAVQAVLITIGTALLPVLSSIVAKIVPVISAFADWVIKSHIVEQAIAALGVIFGTVGTILGPVVGVFMGFIGILSKVITWVQHNETAMTAFKFVLIAIGAIIAVALIAVLLVVVIIMAAWAIVIGVVIAVIMLVITIVKNWGNIMAWFGGIFSWIGSVVHTVITAIGAAFSWLGSVVHTVLLAIGSFFSWLGTQAHNAVATVGSWFDWLGTHVKAFATGLIAAVLGFFTWLYNHNYYVKNFVDAFVIGLKQIGVWFDWLGTHVKAVLDTIGKDAGGFFSALGTTAHNGVTTVGTWFDWLGTHVHAVWDTTRTATGNFFSFLGTQAHAGTTSAGNAFSVMGTFINGVWNNVRTAVGSFFSWLGGFVHTQLANIGSFFYQAGLNFMHMLANAITAGITWVTGGAMNVANSIKNALGFHSPTKEGPGKDADKWAPALMTMLTTGMLAGIPRIASASRMIAQAMNPASGSNAFALGGSSSSNQPVMNVYVEMDGRVMTQAIGVRQAKEVRIQAGLRNR